MVRGVPEPAAGRQVPPSSSAGPIDLIIDLGPDQQGGMIVQPSP